METLYKITNKLNGMYYYGSTKDFEFRKHAHNKTSRITNKQRKSNSIYDDIEKYGIENFIFEKILESDDIVEISRMESRLIRMNLNDSNCYNLMQGASGRKVFYDSDIIFIRELYNSKTMNMKEAYEKYYKNIVTERAFKKVWFGEVFKDIYYHVYTEENKRFHYSKGQSRPHEKNGKAVLTIDDVRNIRRRRDNGEPRQIVMNDYSNKIGMSGFISVWKNRTWKDVC